jgi:hypothetical protein
MTAETIGVDVVAILLFDAPQPIKNVLLRTNESRIMNEEKRRKIFFLVFLLILFF